MVMPQLSEHSRQPVRVRPRVPDSQRKRVAKACRRCRFRKSRCIVATRGSLPLACRRCLSADVGCVFDDATSPAPRTPRDASQSAPGPILSVARSREEENDGVLWPQCSQDTPQDAALSPHSGRLVVRNPHQTHFVGEVSNGTFLAQVKDAVIAESPEEATGDVDLGYSRSYDPEDLDSAVARAATQALPPRNVANFLVHVFFHAVEANYYYMDREGFKARLGAYYDSSSHTDSDPSFLCLVLMVLAMGSQFAELQGPRRPGPPGPSTGGGPGTVFYLKAKGLLSDVVTQCSLESIQACFLMGLFLLPSNISDLSYVYHGMALKMAISAGLHRRISGANLDQKITSVRNRLWWSLYTSERRLTIILDRPESIREEDINAPLPEPSPELDFPEAEDNISNLQASIALTRTFNKVVRIGKAAGFQQDTQEDAVVSIKRDLDTWAGNLPARLKLDNLSPDMKSFRGAVHLHMSHNQILIYMGRSSLLQQVQKHLKGEPHPVEPSSHEASLVRDCVSAAFKIIQLINYLYENGKLARFSFTDLNCCSTAALIIMISELVRQHPLYRSSMELAMQAMTYMATGCGNAKQGLKLMMELQRVIYLLRARMAREREMSATVDSQTMGYDEWERWAALGGTVVASVPETPTSLSGAALGDGGDLEACFPYEPLQDSLEGDRMQNAFYSVWPDNLDSLGLGVFEDFTNPTF